MNQNDYDDNDYDDFENLKNINIKYKAKALCERFIDKYIHNANKIYADTYIDCQKLLEEINKPAKGF